MILLWGLLEDPPMKMVHDELRAAGADCHYLDHRRIFESDFEYAYDPAGGETALVRASGAAIDLRAVKAAYFRLYDHRDYEEAAGRPHGDPLLAKAAGFEAQLVAYLDGCSALVINRTGPSATNNSKPHQLAAIRRAGFRIPETVVTNDPDEARRFLARRPDAVFKSVSGQRSIVEQVSARHMEFLDDVQWCPTLFQERVPGINYRAHVLRNEVFAVRIESDSLDYRYGNATMTEAQLPGEVAARCIRLSADLGLHFSGIDLMRTPGGEWYCFEVNPSPGYSYFQSASGQRISAALANMLIAADTA